MRCSVLAIFEVCDFFFATSPSCGTLYDIMITAQPNTWKDLQKNVSFILESVGLITEIEKKIQTPRGEVEIDVYAIDGESLDKIKYIIECKNWNKRIAQNVIHGFTTVMHETGGNIGYIISKKGFQKGSEDYIRFTNIRLFTYDEFQKKYFENWYKNYFSKEINNINYELICFTEPINSLRITYQKKFTLNQNQKYVELLKKYSLFADFTLAIGSTNYVKTFDKNEYELFSLKQIDKVLYNCFGVKNNFQNYNEALVTLRSFIYIATNEFIELFGKNIFK